MSTFRTLDRLCVLEDNVDLVRRLQTTVSHGDLAIEAYNLRAVRDDPRVLLGSSIIGKGIAIVDYHIEQGDGVTGLDAAESITRRLQKLYEEDPRDPTIFDERISPLALVFVTTNPYAIFNAPAGTEIDYLGRLPDGKNAPVNGRVANLAGAEVFFRQKGFDRNGSVVPYEVGVREIAEDLDRFYTAIREGKLEEPQNLRYCNPGWMNRMKADDSV
ncbi:hypothetical protein HYV86_07575 [Candidatus Woesearchaeota archaeon]|nr:hypothetical protein [Candidatus Woesearchaeota archaeon]